MDAAIEPIPVTDVDSAEVKEVPKYKIVTTERELDSFAIAKEQFERSALYHGCIFDASARKEVPIQIAYKDTTGYFCVYFNKPSWWALRVVTEARQPWVGFNVDPATAVQLIPTGFARMEAHPFAEFRLAISGPQDLNGLHRLVYAAFQNTIEDRKIGRDAEAQSTVAGGRN